MGRRKGVPEVGSSSGPAEGVPVPETRGEETPPAPPPREGSDKNPELVKKRHDVAKGIWDPKKSAALAKQLPPDKLVKQWEPVGEMFATMTDVAIIILFGPSEGLKVLASGISEREMVIQAWAARLAVEPPENIKGILTANLVFVYGFIMLPRVQRVWLKPAEELEPCAAKLIKEARSGGKQKEPDHGVRGGTQGAPGNARVGAGKAGGEAGRKTGGEVGEA